MHMSDSLPYVIKRQKIRKHFLVDVGYLKICQHLVLRSLSFDFSLSTSSTQEWQLCAGKLLPFPTGTRACKDEKASLLAILEESRGILGLYFYTTDLAESLAAALTMGVSAWT